ncbi:Threonine-tRNA ligase 1 [Methanoculleus chikugoensis]|uniref:Threonine--tRNA ligase n=1 Tax=Methanoculleus chikugoensis TaxID=118126 RepID=A0A1M4MJC6_9EURY|nr:threonine--tRNA ligase [Methanoculleus chikugoensis]SCL75031.1 Threonine-tRNA ligase 1 [Methanoculleus chikugoensis]
MRLLLIHSDHIEYEARKKTKVAEEDAVPKDALDEALAVFCAVESVDEENIEDAVRQAADEIITTARQLGTTNIMIYPYAHLSSDLASPDAAVSVLKGIQETLAGIDDVVVKRAPFGWYKAFSLSCKGHPLSELSRTIVPGEGAAAPKKEIEHEFFVVTPEGDRKDAADYAKENTPFASLIRKELGYPGPEGGEPAHVDLMRAKELVEYEPRSDVGHHRWMPRGKLIRDLLSDYVLSQVLEYGGMPVETPVMYDLGDRAISEHAAKFGERQYRFKSGNRDMMLRFAACFGMFSIMHDMHISPNTLPMKLYELSTYSFRHEQKGEVIGLKRLRAFTMPDMHTLCRDVDGALTAFEEQLAIGWKSGEDLETPLVGIFRCTRDFFEQYELWVKGIVAKSGVPMLVEVLSERTHYWIAKADLAAIDAQGRPIENPTVQIDVESADRFDIKYYAPDGTEVHPPILHCSPTGSIERVICAMLENTATQEVPSFPTWLAPTQVRLVPVAERHVCFAEEIGARLNATGIRADVDDRDESVNKKVREAGMDWVPYVAVIGDQEAETGRLMVTIRRLSAKKKPYKESMTESELIQAVKLETAGKPFRQLYTPKLLSRKPRFI